MLDESSTLLWWIWKKIGMNWWWFLLKLLLSKMKMEKEKFCAIRSVEVVKKRENFDFQNLYIVLGYNPMWCSHYNNGELTSFLKYFIHPPIHHQLKNTCHVLKNPFMQRKMHLGSFGIQKSFGNWNPEIPGTNAQNHSNRALSLYELYGTKKYTWKHF